MINPHGTPGRIIDLLSAGAIEVAIDDRIFAEYSNVLERPRFKLNFPDFERISILEFIRFNGIHAKTSVVVTDLPDKGDIPFLEIALSLEVPLVTGNLKHFPKNKIHNCRIISPADFINHFGGLK